MMEMGELTKTTHKKMDNAATFFSSMLVLSELNKRKRKH